MQEAHATMSTLTTRDSCLHELLWWLCQGMGLCVRHRAFVRNAWAQAGTALLVLAVALVGGVLVLALAGHFHGNPSGVGFLITLGSAIAAAGAGLAGICFGSHPPPSTGTFSVTGADVRVHTAAPDAPLGILVTVGGYGSASPAFCEPPFVNDPDLAPENLRSQLLRFRYRVALRLHGGLGWDYADTLAIADSLEQLLQTAPLAAASALPCVVVAHSRGTQVVAATRTFRSPNWQRFAVHPPAGVNPLLRLFSGLSPEIAEIQRYGELAKQAEPSVNPSPVGDPAAQRLAGFSWTVMYQAKGWDHTVIRFRSEPGRPVCNLSPWGTHTLPFTAGTSRVWRDLQARFAAIAPPDNRVRYLV